MHRCFIQEQINGDNVIISGAEAAHMLKVLRFKKGDAFEICDGSGIVAKAVVSSISGNELSADITETKTDDAEPDIKLYLFQGLSKGTKMELVIQKAVELGASAIIPVEMKRSVVKVKDEDKKTDRWRKIALEAVKQCKRAVVPEVYSPVDFKTAADMLSRLDIALVPYEEEKECSIKSVLEKASGKSGGFMIGPEGGFAPEEIEYIKSLDIPCVTLGKRILRTETAAISVLSVMMYELS